MNLDPVEKVFGEADAVKLDEKKKDAIHQEILLFMKKNPLVEGGVKKNRFGFLGRIWRMLKG